MYFAVRFGQKYFPFHKKSNNNFSLLSVSLFAYQNVSRLYLFVKYIKMSLYYLNIILFYYFHPIIAILTGRKTIIFNFQRIRVVRAFSFRK